MASSDGEHEVDEQPSWLRRVAARRSRTSRVPAANLALWSASRSASPGVRSTPPKPKRSARRASSPRPLSATAARRSSDHEHGGGGADGRAGGDVRVAACGACAGGALNALSAGSGRGR